eukprot:195924-Lingulodinium_polyedra.AAC.1
MNGGGADGDNSEDASGGGFSPNLTPSLTQRNQSPPGAAGSRRPARCWAPPLSARPRRPKATVPSPIT